MTRLQKRTLHVAVATVGFVLGLVASGCLDSTATCNNNLKACGTTCADVSSDKNNCGACGNACALGQVCQSGACVCESGTEQCGGACVVTQSDPANCGACGNACPSGQVCESGACKTSCTLGSSSVCNGACVDLQNDVNNCGACGTACNSGQVCASGTCSYSVIAACYNTGALAGVDAQSLQVTHAGISASPFLIAAHSPVLYSVGNDGMLRQFRLSDLTEIGSGVSFASSDPEGLLSAPPNVYVVDATNNALTVFQGPDAGTATNGYPLAVDAGYSFGANANPHNPALLDNVLYVPFYGNLGGNAPGTKVAKVDVTNPASPQDAGVVDLSSLDLHTFDGGTAYAEPNAATVFNGKVYVTLNSLDSTYAVAGPALLAKIDPNDGGVSEVNLGSDVCLQPYAAVPVGNNLVVSCAGSSDYSNWPTITTTKSGLVLVDSNDQRVAAYAASCTGQPADAGCVDPSLGHLTAVGQRVFAADQAGGRLFVVDVADGGFSEVRGYGADGGPLVVCTDADGGSAGQLVSDVTAAQ